MTPGRGLADSRLMAEIESLLGKRPDKKNRALRWSDMEQFRKSLIDAGGAGTLDGPAPRTGDGTSLPAVRGSIGERLMERLLLAERQIDAAEEEAQRFRDSLLNAEAAASDAQGMIKRGFGTILDQFLSAGSGWTTSGTAAAISVVANEAYAYGSTWALDVAEGVVAGVQLVSSHATGWPGQKDAEAYVIEVEYTHVSGDLDGAAVICRWTNSDGTNRDTRKTLLSLQAGVSAAAGTRVARGVFRRPSNVSGTFASNRVLVMANSTGSAPLLAAKHLRVHRISVRVATQEEIGAGEVLVNVQTYLTNNYYTTQQSDAAIAESEQRTGVVLGNMSADVTRHSTAFASLNGSVARLRDVVTVGGGRQAAGLEAIAWDTEGNGSGSLVLLHGDQTIAKGTLSANVLVAGYGNNLVQNSRFYDRLTHWRGGGGNTETILRVREAGNTYAHPSFRTLELYQNGTGSGEYFLEYAAEQDGALPRILGAPCRPGQWYGASGYIANLRCSGRVEIRFFDVDGVNIPGSNVASDISSVGGSSSNPDLWTRAFVKAQAPVGACYVGLRFRKTATNAGSVDSRMFIWKPMIEETHDMAAVAGPYASNETSMMTGDMIYSRTLAGRHLVTDEAIITGQAQMGSAVVGSAQIRNLAVDTFHLAGNSVTVQWSSNSESLTISLPYSARLMVFTSARIMGTFATHNTEYRLYRNGTVIDSTIFSVDEYTNPYVWMRAISVSAGTHEFTFDYTRVSGSDTTTSYNTRRIAIFGAFK